MDKLCKDCNFYKKFKTSSDISSGLYSTCIHPNLKKDPNPINGEIPPTFCNIARISNDKCGPEAKFFEPRPLEPKSKSWFDIVKDALFLIKSN